ncbi:MAG: sugar phosphate isomerase/epimerase [Thermoguttaceae bacterium]|nr:sugar phosphate isomerase/epimerase [Thermoguttaceae bacterium]
MNLSRRSFFTAAGAATASLALNDGAKLLAQDVPSAREPKFELGLASYSFRKFDVDQTIAWCKKAEIKKISLKDFHLALKSSDEECAAMAKKFQDAGMEVYSCGVVYMSKEADIDNAFRYAKALGCVSIVGVPEWDLLPYAEKKVKETGILLAIHNHGPEDKRYPTAKSVWERVKDMDPGVGIALDTGHAIRAGEDPIQAVRDYSSRIFDFHVKDMTEWKPSGRGVICGRGSMDLLGLMRALIEVGYDRVAPFEYEIDENDPFPGFMESLGYVRGLLAAIRAGV